MVHNSVEDLDRCITTTPSRIAGYIGGRQSCAHDDLLTVSFHITFFTLAIIQIHTTYRYSNILQHTMTQVQLDPEEYAQDLEINLGRANGNVFLRKPGVEGVNDGQIMVRLKKKRFIIIDYSIEPTDADLQAAELSPNIAIPVGAGKTKCNTPSCTKVGIPILLHDSEPHEPTSLYLRSGLCFQCQRNLNEKRRTERKRPAGDGKGGPSLIYALGPSDKKFKLNGKTIHLNSEAIIINGGVEGVKPYGEGYGFHEIGTDLQSLAQEAAVDADRLVNAVSSNTASAAAAVAAVGDAELSAEAAANAVAEATTNALLEGNDNEEAPSSEDISVLYDKAFQSMNKSIFLLSQWKASWDAAVAAAQETVADASLADAVASAAAVVAAAADGQDQSSNMVSLLLAADKDQGTVDPKDVEEVEI